MSIVTIKKKNMFTQMPWLNTMIWTNSYYKEKVLETWDIIIMVILSSR